MREPLRGPARPRPDDGQPFSQWTQIFKDPMTTAAAIDRLVHHSVILELNVASYRLETAQSAKKATAEPAVDGGKTGG